MWGIRGEVGTDGEHTPAGRVQSSVHTHVDDM